MAGATLPLLAALVDKSLVRHVTDVGGRTRYDLHELLRQFALAKLQSDSDEETSTYTRHCAYYARLLGERTEAFQSGNVHRAWTEVAPELDSIRTAWTWAVRQRDHAALAQMGQSL